MASSNAEETPRTGPDSEVQEGPRMIFKENFDRIRKLQALRQAAREATLKQRHVSSQIAMYVEMKQSLRALQLTGESGEALKQQAEKLAEKTTQIMAAFGATVGPCTSTPVQSPLKDALKKPGLNKGDGQSGNEKDDNAGNDNF